MAITWLSLYHCPLFGDKVGDHFWQRGGTARVKLIPLQSMECVMPCGGFQGKCHMSWSMLWQSSNQRLI